MLTLSMANCQIGLSASVFETLITIGGMRDFAILLVHLIVTLARLAKRADSVFMFRRL